jgi:hypothetical protein
MWQISLLPTVFKFNYKCLIAPNCEVVSIATLLFFHIVAEIKIQTEEALDLPHYSLGSKIGLPEMVR